jgi:uncharacterized membrane protein YhaH (DUF805 family)
MVLCASLFIVIIWLGEDNEHQTLFQIVATLFVFGLANFLFWASLIVYRFLEKK